MTYDTSGESYAMPFENCRNITASYDQLHDRKILVGQAPAHAVLRLEDNENVREYLVDAQGKQKRSPTLVHQAIRKTLETDAEQFNVLNGGLVIVASAAEIDDKNKVLHLKSASIINGSQTQGELRRFYKKFDNDPDVEPTIKFEIIVTKNTDLVAEISIARNFQNDVKPISIAGRLGQLDELENSMKTIDPSAKLRKTESDLTNDSQFLDTEKIIQVTFALLPESVMAEAAERIDPSNKVFSYSQKTRCLRLFQQMVDSADVNRKVYDDFLEIAPIAWKLYTKWKSHQGFKGTRIRSIEREDGRIVDVPDGVIFPIVAAHASFLQYNGAQWSLLIPTMYTDDEMIEATKQAYFEIANHNPQTMGKNKACYSTLSRMTSIYAKFA